MKNATGDEIREEMSYYLKYSRIAYEEMLKTILPNSDYVVDGNVGVNELVKEIIYIIEDNGEVIES
jgi:hypothetical protein